MKRRDLVHGVFTCQNDVLAALKARCIEKQIDFHRFAWIGSEQAGHFDSGDRELAVVLEVTLGDFKETFSFAWEWAASRFKEATIIEEFGVLLKSMEALPGSSFQPWTIRWTRIKLDAYKKGKAQEVRAVEKSPGLGILFLAAEHPQRIERISSKGRRAVSLPAIVCSVAGATVSGSMVPYVGMEPIHTCLRRSGTRLVLVLAGMGRADNVMGPTFIPEYR
jgi:hypothetical protein